MGIESYSTTPASNTAISGINVAENCPIAGINNAIRQLMADGRSQWNDAQWFQNGDGDGTATVAYASATSFTIAGVDVTAVWHAARRVKIVAATPGTIYGTISSSAFATDTTVNVTFDSGSLSNEALTAYLAVLSATGTSFPANFAKTGAANTFTADQTIQSTDAGASSGPQLIIDRFSASPAANDLLGVTTYRGRDSAGNSTQYVQTYAKLIDPVDASEDAQFVVQCLNGASAVAVATFGQGVQIGAPTGGDPGAGKLNATELQQGGVAVQTKLHVAKLVDSKTSGTNGGTSVADTWTKHTLTEETDADAIVSVASSVFTLGAGTYIMDFAGSFSGGSSDSDAALRIQNTTDASTAGRSTNSGTMFAADENNTVIGTCIVTIAGAKNFELQYYHTVAVTNVGLGSPLSSGENEIYAWVKILKIA